MLGKEVIRQKQFQKNPTINDIKTKTKVIKVKRITKQE
jgi:hypothetical protein